MLVVGCAPPALELAAQETLTPATPVHSPLFRNPLFTEADMIKFRAKAAEEAARRETYIRAAEDDDVVLLEPYIVRGDDSLLLARIRRALERNALGTRRIFIGLTDEARRDLLFARRQQDEFFRPGSPGRPSDAPAFEGINFLELPSRLRPENLPKLFSAPAQKVGE
jgi:hypothetical protein